MPFMIHLMMASLSDIIVETIKGHGPISFKDFMENALYHPQLGYYISEKQKLGPQGDFYTSPELTPIFGKIVTHQLVEMWEYLGRRQFTIVEYGAGTDSLCRDILCQSKGHSPFYDGLRYIIIEKSPAMRTLQKKTLFEKVRWVETVHELPAFSGCILSNELIDNFAVHVVVMEDQLMEVYVDYDQGFVEILKPAGQQLLNYFDEQQLSLPRGFRTEVNLEALQWIKEVSQHLEEGFVLTMDYGYSAAELCETRNKSGSIMCYYRHTVNDNPFHLIGEQDITAHVNFSALKHWGAKYGLTCCGYTTQAQFLRSLGIMRELRSAETQDLVNRSDLKKINSLIFGLGQKIKLMIQQKGKPCKFLTGLQFASPL